MRRIGHPYRRQIAGTMLERQLLGIPPVGLDPLARLAGDQARCRDGAGMTKGNKLTVDAVTAAARFIAKIEIVAVFGKTPDQLRDVVGDVTP